MDSGLKVCAAATHKDIAIRILINKLLIELFYMRIMGVWRSTKAYCS